MSKLKKKGKGIILIQDFQRSTAKSMPELLKALKDKGYIVVHLTENEKSVSIDEYDAEIEKEFGGPTANAKPLSSVVRTITGK